MKIRLVTIIPIYLFTWFFSIDMVSQSPNIEDYDCSTSETDISLLEKYFKIRNRFTHFVKVDLDEDGNLLRICWEILFC